MNNINNSMCNYIFKSLSNDLLCENPFKNLKLRQYRYGIHLVIKTISYYKL